MDVGPDSIAIKTLYQQYRQPLIKWLMDKYGIDIDVATDIYQDCIVIYIENIYINNTTTIRANVKKKTYLYGIAKNKAREYLKQKSKTYILTEIQRDQLIAEHNEDNGEDRSKIDRATKAFENLGDRCQQLLTKAIVHKLSMKEIALELQYQNAKTAKNLKYKCLQQLRKLFFQLNKRQNG